jgi:DNA-binding response OmpR family regulator
MRVLLVDDEEEFVSTLAERLTIRGIDAQWVSTGSKAIELVKTEPFDLAILDVKMPRLGGLALKEVLQATRPGMKFVFVTGYGSEEEFRAITAEVGTEYYLVKPIDIETLIERMRSILGAKRGES